MQKHASNLTNLETFMKTALHFQFDDGLPKKPTALMQMELDAQEGRRTRFQRRSELEGSDEDSEGVETGPRTFMRYKKDLLWTNVLCGELSF